MAKTQPLLLPEPAKGRAKRPSVPPGAPVKRLIDYFYEAHLRRHGFAVDGREWGRFGKEVKALVAAWGEETVRALIDDWFFDAELQVQHWIVKEWRPAQFTQAAQRLMLRRNGQRDRRPDQRTADNLDAADRATGGKLRQRKG